MKDEILVTRRATYKAEEAVSGLEKDKGRQDLFIDRLMEQASETGSVRFVGTLLVVLSSKVMAGFVDNITAPLGDFPDIAHRLVSTSLEAAAWFRTSG